MTWTIAMMPSQICSAIWPWLLVPTHSTTTYNNTKEKGIHDWALSLIVLGHYTRNLSQIQAQWIYCVNIQAQSGSLYLAVICTFGLMLSSSPLLNLHSTCCVASPPTPKLRAWRGENSCRHICRQTTTKSPRVETKVHTITLCIQHQTVQCMVYVLPQTGAWAEQESLQQTGHQVLCLCCRTQIGCAAKRKRQIYRLRSQLYMRTSDTQRY